MQEAVRVGAWAKAGVPYEVVDYITNDTVESFFDTGVQATFSMEARCKFVIGEFSQLYYKALFGSGWGSDGSSVFCLSGWYGGNSDGKGTRTANGWGKKQDWAAIYDTGNTIEYSATIDENGRVLETINGETNQAHTILDKSRPNLRVLQIGSNSFTANAGSVGTRCYPFYIRTEDDEMDAVCVNVDGKGAYFDMVGNRLLMPAAGSFSLPA